MITWHLLPEVPDAEIAVLVATEDAADATEGYYDGAHWFYQGGMSIEAEVYAWADLPECPKRAPDGSLLLAGAELIAEERSAHFTREDWTPAHDDKHTDGQIARAAACYVLPCRDRERGENATPGLNRYTLVTLFDQLWPWEIKWWKPSPHDRIRELTKGGALCAAEIDRLQRARMRGAS